MEERTTIFEAIWMTWLACRGFAIRSNKRLIRRFPSAVLFTLMEVRGGFTFLDSAMLSNPITLVSAGILAFIDLSAASRLIAMESFAAIKQSGRAARLKSAHASYSGSKGT